MIGYAGKLKNNLGDAERIRCKKLFEKSTVKFIGVTVPLPQKSEKSYMRLWMTKRLTTKIGEKNQD